MEGKGGNGWKKARGRGIYCSKTTAEAHSSSSKWGLCNQKKLAFATCEGYATEREGGKRKKKPRRIIDCGFFFPSYYATLFECDVGIYPPTQ